MTIVTSLEQLAALYGEASEAAVVKVTDRVISVYRPFIEASPFAALATCGPEGLDCSPRGDGPGFIRIQDEKTLLLPDRRGNNRTDSLRNIVRDPRVALFLMIPGSGTTLRINGTAVVSIDDALCESLAMDGKAPRSVIVLTIAEIYFQCSRAIVRADLWNPARHVAPGDLPSPGRILAAMSGERVGGEAYDRAWPARAAASLW